MARNVDEDREEIRELKSEPYDQSTAHQLRPIEGEKMQVAGNYPDLQPGDETILPYRGRPAERTPGSSVRNHGVLDPVEHGHPVPEGLERKRLGPLNRNTGRRLKP